MMSYDRPWITWITFGSYCPFSIIHIFLAFFLFFHRVIHNAKVVLLLPQIRN